VGGDAPEAAGEPKPASEPKPAAGSGAGYDPFDDEELFDDVDERSPPPAEAAAAAGVGVGGAAANASNSNSTVDEELAAEEKKQRPLPHEWLPSAGACVCLFGLATLHALFYLMCRWSISFRLRTFYTPSAAVEPGCCLCFKPQPHKGRAEIVPLARSKRTGRLECEFQRVRYEYLPAEEARTELRAARRRAAAPPRRGVARHAPHAPRALHELRELRGGGQPARLGGCDARPRETPASAAHRRGGTSAAPRSRRARRSSATRRRAAPSARCRARATCR